MSTDAQKEAAKRRQQNKRDRDSGRPETYPAVPKELIEQRLNQHQSNLEWARAQDELEFYHRSECRSLVDLLGIYEGKTSLDREDEVDETDTKIEKEKKAKKKKNRLNPSQTKILGAFLSFQQWLRLRDFYRKNLFHLAKFLLGFTKLVYRVHKPVCDVFVQKNFDGIYYKDYGAKDIEEIFWRHRESRSKFALLLDPRGFFKTSINIADVVQWLLNCPDIKILLLTAENKRAVELLVAVKDYFRKDEERPTNFQLLYPEYLLEGVDSTSSQPLDCPARKASLPRVGHSLWVKSEASQKTGSHADVIKRDDIVTPENSKTEDLRASAKESADDTANLILEHGFVDTIGTRYSGGKDPDYYGVVLQRESDLAPEDRDLKYFVRPCWVVKPEWADLTLKNLQFEMVDLTFPEHGRTPRMAFKALRQKLLANERMFRNQQLNEPSDPNEDSRYIFEFDEDVLRAHCYPESAAPKEGRVVQMWDFSYGERKTSDFSAGITARIYQTPEGKWAVCILKIICEKWKSSDLSFNILQFYADAVRKGWNPDTVLIERANGADWLFDNLKLTAGKYNVPDIINKIRLEPVDLSHGAKKNRVKSLQILINDDRLHFVNGAWLDETFKQLTKFTGEKSTGSRHDDIPDALSFVVKFLPRTALMTLPDPKEAEAETEEIVRKANLAFMYKRMFSGPSPTAPPPPEAPQGPQVDPRRAAMNKLFGNNGMRA